MAKKWYIVHTQTGYEDRIKSNLEKRLKNIPISNQFAQILIPTEKVSEVRDGKKTISERKVFPGYVFIEMELTEESWHLVKSVQGITGFIGPGSRPQALKDSEIENIIRQAEEKKEKPIPKIAFEIGESVRIREGPFINFNGTIEEVNPVKQKLKAKVLIFGRSTPVELEYWQVEKL